MAGVMDKVKAKVDQVMHKDKAHHDPHDPHSSYPANTADPLVSNTNNNYAVQPPAAHGGHGLGTTAVDTHGSTTHSGMTGHTGGVGGTGTGAYNTTTHGGLGSSHNNPTGPHSSDLANKMDPRVGGGAGKTDATPYDTTTTHGGLGNPHNDPTGPHHSHTANTMDPRVGGVGSTGTGAYNTTTSTTTHGGLGSSHNNPTGPHSSDLANKMDPRVGGGVGKTETTPYGTTSTHGGLGNSHNDPTGPHHSHTANAMDSRVGGVGSTGTGQYGDNVGYTGTAHNSTVHPHEKPSMMDKLNPKKDADHDGKAGFMK